MTWEEAVESWDRARRERGDQDETPTVVPPVGHAADARMIMLSIQKLEDREAELAETRRRISGDYQREEAKLDARRRELVRLLEGWLEHRGGPLSLPDVGTAWLQTRPPRVEVTDAAAFGEWAFQRGHVRTVADLGAARKAVLDSGELAPGAVILPGYRSLSMRRGTLPEASE